MERLVAFDYCLGLLSLLLLQGVLNVEGRSLFSPGNNVFDPREDTDPEGKILAMLLQKSLDPVETKDPLGETENTQTICTSSECFLAVISNIFLIADCPSFEFQPLSPAACFWKYCV
uniref:Uncharacterized protein n=1 Tax=Takifugu rubripes TaxID=31033 RepID=A0A3B5KCR5_TAKRU